MEHTPIDDDDDAEETLLEEPIPEPSRTLTHNDRVRIRELCETALEAQLEVGRQIGKVPYYGLGTIARPAGGVDDEITIPHYAPRRGVTMVDLIGALATGRAQHPQGPVGAVARALFVRFEHAEALEVGWDLSDVAVFDKFPEYDRDLMLMAHELRTEYASLADDLRAA